MEEHEALERLLKMFYINSYGQLEWSYIEGTPVDDIDEELGKFLLKLCKDSEHQHSDGAGEEKG